MGAPQEKQPTRKPVKRANEMKRAMTELQTSPTEGMFRGLGLLIVDSILTEDRKALEVAFDGLQKSLHPSYKLSEKDTGKVEGIIEVVSVGLRRILPEVTEQELDTLTSFAASYKPDSPLLFRLNPVIYRGFLRPMRIGGTVFMHLTPKGKAILDRHQREQPQEE